MLRRLAAPNVVIGPPYNHASQSFLRWWHVDVENVKREGSWFKPVAAKECLVKFEFVPVGGGTTTSARGMWDTPKGPVERKTLVLGEPPSPVSIVLRSSENDWLYGVAIEPGTVYITGLQFLSQQNGAEQLSLGDYRLKMIIYSGPTVWKTVPFYLEIRAMELGGCVLSEWPGNL